MVPSWMHCNEIEKLSMFKTVVLCICIRWLCTYIISIIAENPQLSWQSDTTTKEPSSTASSKSLQIISQPKTQEIQCGSDAIFSCRANGSHGQVVTYEWYKGNTKIYTDTSGVFTIRMVTNEDEGEYHCVAICESHKVESKIAHLHVKPGKLFS